MNCPMCGAAVRIVAAGEGTQSYDPLLAVRGVVSENELNVELMAIESAATRGEAHRRARELRYRLWPGEESKT